MPVFCEKVYKKAGQLGNRIRIGARSGPYYKVVFEGTAKVLHFREILKLK